MHDDKCVFIVNSSLECLGQWTDAIKSYISCSTKWKCQEAPHTIRNQLRAEILNSWAIAALFWKVHSYSLCFINSIPCCRSDASGFGCNVQRHLKLPGTCQKPAPVLAQYDLSLPIKIAGDASAHGIMAVVFHAWQWTTMQYMMFVSDFIYINQQAHVQIERQALSLVFTVQHFTSSYCEIFVIACKPLLIILVLRLEFYQWLLFSYSYGHFMSLLAVNYQIKLRLESFCLQFSLHACIQLITQ